MRVLILNIETGERIFRNYPRNDFRPISRKADNLMVYEIFEADRPDYDYMLYKLNVIEKFIDDEHLGRYDKSYEKELLPIEQIIENLNNSVGAHLDTAYPEWERSKHAGESLRFVIKGQSNWDVNDMARINYIQNTADWCRSCRLLRDIKEKELVEENILPNFEWPERPINPFKI